MNLKNIKTRWEASPKALEYWNPQIRAKSDDDLTINMYEQIGEDPFDGSGMTAKIVSSVLRKAENKPITVNINSYGGEMFEGFAIYNLLKEYEGDVTIKVLGIAASAASLIAMAGDEVIMGKNAMLMIHNAWSIVLGNQFDFAEASKLFAKFDEQQCEIYKDKTGMDEKSLAKMLKADTYLKAQEAIDMGFADKLMGDDEIEEDAEQGANALRKVDTALAKTGMPRSERRALIKELTGTPCATDNKDVTPCANNELSDALHALLNTAKSLVKGEIKND